MKPTLLRLLIMIGVGCTVCQSKAQLNMNIYEPQLACGIDRSTGNLIATDVWNNREHDAMAKDSGRQSNDHFELIDKVGPYHLRVISKSPTHSGRAIIFLRPRSGPSGAAGA
jgi:hypothetical protein